MRGSNLVVELSGGWCAIGLVVVVNGDCLELGHIVGVVRLASKISQEVHLT